jgi:hypothetical protein
MSRRQIKSTAAELINARATPHEARIRLAERDRRLATEDTRTEAERWLGDHAAMAARARAAVCPIRYSASRPNRNHAADVAAGGIFPAR